jgi:tetratricopeptide (TPR) repeat protein
MIASPRVRWFGGIAALAVVFGLKLAVLSTFGQHPLLVPAGELDAAYYYHLAQRVGSGDLWLLRADGFFGETVPAFFVSPLYVYVLALFLKIGGGSVETARFAQMLLGTIGVGLIALAARRWYGAAAGWWAGALAGLFGLFTFFELLIVPAALDPFLTALDVYLLTRAIQADDRRAQLLWGLTAGGALGLHALNRPPMLIVIAGLAIFMALRNPERPTNEPGRRPPRALGRLLVSFAFLLAALLVIAPATIRNYRATGRVVLISSPAGLNFLIGNGPEADGLLAPAMGVMPGVRAHWMDATQVVRTAYGRDVAPADVSGFYWHRALGWIREHPGREARLLAKKSWYTLSAGFLPVNHSYPFFVRDLGGPLAWLIVGPALVVPLGLVGLVVARPRREGYGIWAMYAPLAILSVVVFYVAARYRLPYQMALCAPAGGLIAWAIGTIRARAWRSLLVPAGAAVAAAVLVLWPTRLYDGRGEEQTRMGLQEIQADRFAEGEAWITKAAANHHLPDIVHLRAGQIYEMRNQPAPAITHYRKALAMNPNEPALHFALGRALYKQRQDADAVAALERARGGRHADAATRLLVLALSRLGRPQEANAAVRTLDPSRWDADTAREFALSLADVDRIDLSVTAWQRAAEASQDARDFDRLGLSWAMLGNQPQAIAAFSSAVARDPKSPSIRLNYAVAWASVRRYTDARREAENALKLNPGYERAKEFLRSLPK